MNKPLPRVNRPGNSERRRDPSNADLRPGVAPKRRFPDVKPWLWPVEVIWRTNKDRGSTGKVELGHKTERLRAKLCRQQCFFRARAL